MSELKIQISAKTGIWCGGMLERTCLGGKHKNSSLNSEISLTQMHCSIPPNTFISLKFDNITQPKQTFSIQ